MKEVIHHDPIQGDIVIGHIDGDRFIKKVKRHKHFMYKYGGYAIQKWAVDKFKNVKYIDILQDDGTEYTITVEKFREIATEFDEGHGPQYVVNKERYDILVRH